MNGEAIQRLNGYLGAARAGVKSLSQSMGGEWGQYGVMINNIAPGVVYSDSAIANYGPLGNLRFYSL